MAVRLRGLRRPPWKAGVATLALGDVTAIGLFVTAGLLKHAINPLEHPVHAAGTATPFLVGWLLVAPLGGAYAARTTRSVQATIGRITALWVGAALLGAAIRATPLFHGGAPPSFVAVNVAVGLPFVLGWRLVAVGLRRRVRRP